MISQFFLYSHHPKMLSSPLSKFTNKANKLKVKDVFDSQNSKYIIPIEDIIFYYINSYFLRWELTVRTILLRSVNIFIV